MSLISEYLAETARLTSSLDNLAIEQVIEVLERAWREERRIFSCGNGGSGSLASHMACDFNKGCSHPGRPRLKVVALTDNLATITAYANDVSYDEVFVEQLQNLYCPGDVVLGISGSGNSENVVRAMTWARDRGAVTVGFLGFGGGRLRALCDVAVVADSYDMQHCEDVHVILMHLLMKVFERKVAESHVG